MKLKQIFIILVLLKAQTACAATIELPPQMHYNNKPVNAECLVELTNGILSGKIKNHSINLGKCDNKELKIVEELPKNFLSGFIGYRRKVQYLDLDNTFEIHGEYKYLGKLDNSFVFWLQHDDGGSGNFSHIIALQRHNNEIKLVKKLISGDRCFGGIINAEIKNNTISWAINITPYELLASANKNLNPSSYDKLWDCATCCIGIAQYENDQLKYVMLKKDNIFSSLISPQNNQQICFNEVYQNFINKKHITLNTEDLHDLAGQFSKCQALS